MTENKGFCTVVCDVLANVSKKELLVVSIISLAFLLLLFYSVGICLDEIVGLSLSILPSLLGFTVAAYAILVGAGDKLGALRQIADDGKNPFEVLHASFVFGLVGQCLSLIVVFLANMITKCLDEQVAAFICWFLLIFSILWIVNLTFHLYALRTFVKNNK